MNPEIQAYQSHKIFSIFPTTDIRSIESINDEYTTVIDNTNEIEIRSFIKKISILEYKTVIEEDHNLGFLLLYTASSLKENEIVEKFLDAIPKKLEEDILLDQFEEDGDRASETILHVALDEDNEELFQLLLTKVSFHTLCQMIQRQHQLGYSIFELLLHQDHKPELLEQVYCTFGAFVWDMEGNSYVGVLRLLRDDPQLVLQLFNTLSVTSLVKMTTDTNYFGQTIIDALVDMYDFFSLKNSNPNGDALLCALIQKIGHETIIPILSKPYYFVKIAQQEYVQAFQAIITEKEFQQTITQYIDLEGNTILHLAHHQILKILFNHISKEEISNLIEKRNFSKQTALHVATDNTKKDKFLLLIKYIDTPTLQKIFQKTDLYNRNLFHQLAIHHNFEICKLLLELVNPNHIQSLLAHTDYTGSNVLHIFFQKRNIKGIELLINTLDLTTLLHTLYAINAYGTPLHHLVYADSEELQKSTIIPSLLKRIEKSIWGDLMHPVDNYKMTPLHAAIDQRHIFLIQVFSEQLNDESLKHLLLQKNIFSTTILERLYDIHFQPHLPTLSINTRLWKLLPKYMLHLSLQYGCNLEQAHTCITTTPEVIDSATITTVIRFFETEGHDKRDNSAHKAVYKDTLTKAPSHAFTLHHIIHAVRNKANQWMLEIIIENLHLTNIDPRLFIISHFHYIKQEPSQPTCQKYLEEKLSLLPFKDVNNNCLVQALRQGCSAKIIRKMILYINKTQINSRLISLLGHNIQYTHEERTSMLRCLEQVRDNEFLLPTSKTI